MGEIQSSFARIEKKYVLDPKQYKQVLDAMKKHLVPDAYPHYTICNIYYDTDDYSLVRHSLDKPVYKEKFRVRSYGTATETDTIFAEIKKKYDGVVYKRRVAAPLPDIFKFLDEGKPLGKDPQIQSELKWFYDRTKPAPKVFLAYDRDAYADRDDGELRITFDSNIRYRTDRIDLREGDDGKPVLDEERIVMEVKVAGAFPLWLTGILSRYGVYPASFSKYGMCYKNHLLKKRFHIAPISHEETAREKSIGAVGEFPEWNADTAPVPV